MSYLPKQNSPFEVWNLQVAARTNPATLQRRIQELVRFANQCGLLVKVVGPDVYGGVTPVDDSDPTVVIEEI